MARGAEQIRVDAASAVFDAASKVIRAHAERHTQPTTAEWLALDKSSAELFAALLDQRRSDVRNVSDPDLDSSARSAKSR
jgi:hypothetical protein